jgi:hypothetical protein
MINLSATWMRAAVLVVGGTASVSCPVAAIASDFEAPIVTVMEPVSSTAIRGPINVDGRSQAASGATVDLATLKLLAPDLQMKVGLLALDANTRKINLAYSPGSFTTNLTYNYNGSAQAALSIRRFSMRIEVNTATGNVNSVDLGLVYRGVNFGASADPTQKTADISISYGNGLFPFPPELSRAFKSANGGFQSMAREFHSTPNNQLAYYGIYSNDAGSIRRAIRVARQISTDGKNSSRVGAGLRLHYSEQTGLMIYAGIRINCF